MTIISFKKLIKTVRKPSHFQLKCVDGKLRLQFEDTQNEASEVSEDINIGISHQVVQYPIGPNSLTQADVFSNRSIFKDSNSKKQYQYCILILTSNRVITEVLLNY